MNQTTQISTYQGVTDKTGQTTYVHIAVELIQNSKPLHEKIWSLRQLVEAIEKGNPDPDTEKKVKALYEKEKKQLPAVTWSGTFSTRKADNLINYSGLICIDIDKLSADRLVIVKDRLALDQYSMLVFTSPSGNGLKVVVKVDGGAEARPRNFLALQKYYKYEYLVEIDPSGKDCSRLCFLSSDPDAIVNYNSAVFADRGDNTDSPRVHLSAPELSKAEEKRFQQADNNLDWIKDFTDKKLAYIEGNRNNYVYLFASNCNRKGIDISDCLNYLSSLASDMDTKELSNTIKSAYDNHTHEAGKYAKQQRPDQPAKAKAPKAGNQDSSLSVPATNGQTNGHAYQEEKYIQFWSITEDEKRTDEQGMPLKKYNLKYNRLIEFLEAAGYHRLRLANNSYQYIKFRDNVCEPIGIIDMKDHVLTWLRKKEYDGVLEMMRRGAKSYFVPQIMEGLQYKAIEFGKDTQDEAFFYFKNFIVKVTKSGITTLPYTAAQQAIWASSMIQRDFKPIDLKLPLTPDGHAPIETFEKCEMAKYILLVSHSPHSTEVITDEEASQRFLSICSSIGYMLHGFKNRVSKAIIAVDHKIPEDKSEQNGGTGKSIVGESFKFLKSTTIIDGREFKEDYPFRFEMVGVDTKVVVMQDCKYTLDFGTFFVPITNDFTYNRRHTGYITLPFADAPKWWFDTNFVFKGEGASFRRRMHVIEFDDYFNEHHTPYDEFGHYLFQEWDDAQWNLFFNFYLYCVQLYLSEGLIAYPKSNYESRKMVSETPAEFIDFIDATDEAGVHKTKRNAWFEKKELLKSWNNEAKEMSMQTTTPHLLTKWMKKYVQARPFKLYKDKTNGIEWWLLADEKYTGTGKRSEKPTGTGQTDLPF
jgi:hypothetical protein